MAFTLPSIAVATTADGEQVARFGHDFPLVAVDPAGGRSPRQAEGCCGSLAKAVADCEVVICTAIGRGAAGHLAQAGVRLTIVPEGTTVEVAIKRYRAGLLLPGGGTSACDHRLGHDHAHDAATACGRGPSGSLQDG